MITTRIMGGMGNQMFQYAMGRNIAITHSTDLNLDISSFDKDSMRSYSLGLWKGITAKTIQGTGHLPWVKEIGMPYNIDLVASIPDNCYLNGFWQTERYFSQIAPLLRTEFTPALPIPSRSKDIETHIKSEGNKSAFLTVRRSDYTHSDYHGVLPFEYYLQACKIIADKVVDPHFFVFSDEPDWVKNYFKLPYRMTVGGNYNQTTGDKLGREDAEIWLMKQCKHAVMANSSYSWWGAWLNPDPDRIVVGPKRWFLNSPENPCDIIPERWIKI